MARFAHDCLNKMNLLTKELEVMLGPDTGDLAMRMGLHVSSLQSIVKECLTFVRKKLNSRGNTFHSLAQ